MYNYLSLYDLLKSEFNLLASSLECNDSFDFIIKNDRNAGAFIVNKLHVSLIENINDFKRSWLQGRARHILITFLLGRKLLKFILDENEIDLKLLEMWYFISLYHDKAYFSPLLRKKEFSYEKLSFKLLTNEYKGKLSILNHFGVYFRKFVQAYTYEEIYSYFQYRKRYASENERIDHGILGGFLSFDDTVNEYINFFECDGYEFVFIKECCLVIAQHNIFKSSSNETDEIYRKYRLHKLTSSSPFKIDSTKPFLYFLSLIDTIECVKKFAKSTNKRNYLKTKTVLQNIEIGFNSNNLFLNYTNLHNYITSKKSKNKVNTKVDIERGNLYNLHEEENSDIIQSLNKSFNDYLESVKTLHDWTSYQVDSLDKSNLQYVISCRELLDSLHLELFNIKKLAKLRRGNRNEKNEYSF